MYLIRWVKESYMDCWLIPCLYCLLLVQCLFWKRACSDAPWKLDFSHWKLKKSKCGYDIELLGGGASVVSIGVVFALIIGMLYLLAWVGEAREYENTLCSWEFMALDHCTFLISESIFEPYQFSSPHLFTHWILFILCKYCSCYF